MKFSELVRLLERNGFTLIKEKGSIRYYRKPGSNNLVRVETEIGNHAVIDVPYCLVIEATDDPEFFGFYSPELEGFSGIGNSVEDCLYKARWGMNEHVALLAESKLPVPLKNPSPTVTIQNQDRAVA